jgi:hypothetical protein
MWWNKIDSHKRFAILPEADEVKGVVNASEDSIVLRSPG